MLIIVIGVAVIGGALWYFQNSLSLPLHAIATFGNSVETSVSNQIGQNFSAPSPLQQVSKAAPKKTNTLTIAGVIAQTNDQRATNGNLPPLTENATLDDIATLRIDDMFAQQYFAHVGPQGESAVTVASSVGYTNLALGENLALGLYAGDAGVVTAWMNSPGIARTFWTRIIRRSALPCAKERSRGRTTWIAVQIFGRPASDCPAPDANLKTSIDLSEAQINTMESELATEKASIAAMSPQSGPQYNQQVEDYNNLVAQYNNLAAGTKTAIAEYDTEVNSFNACLAE